MNAAARTPDIDGQPRKGAELDRIWAVWRRRKWLAILVFPLPFVAGATMVFSLPPLYQSSATVLVERQQVPESFVRPTVTSEIETRLQTIRQKILSRSRLEELIERLNLYADLRPRMPIGAIVGRLRGDIRLDLKAAPDRGGRPGTIAFAISYMGRDPQVVALVTNTLANSYVEENQKAREGQATGTTQFLRAQLAATTARLEEQEGRVSEFRKRYMGELPQQTQANLTALETLTAQLRLNSDNQVRAVEHRQTLALQLAESASFGPVPGAPPGIAPAPDSGSMRLARLRQELSELRARYSEKYPDVVRVKGEISALEREFAEAKPGPGGDGPAATPVIPPSPYGLRLREALHTADAELKILKTEEQRLRSTIATYQSRVENAPRREQEFQDISRDYEATRELQQSLRKRYEEAQLAETMEQGQKGEQFLILDPAIPSGWPAAPDRPKLLLMVLALSAGAAVGAVVLAEFLDTSFRSAEDLRVFTGMAVLARIPRIITEGDRRRRRLRVRLAAAGAILGLALVVGAAYFVAHGNEQLVRLVGRERA